MKRATIICLALSLAAVSPGFGEPGKKKGQNAAHAQRAVPARGAPAVGHSAAAMHASPVARSHARSVVVNPNAPTGVRSISHGQARRAENASLRNNGMPPTVATTRSKAVRTAAAQQNVNVTRNVNRNFNVNRNAAAAVAPSGNRVVNFTDARSRWSRQRHERSWWGSHYNRIVLYGGGYYYWDNGWWYPAYGYDPYYSNYAFDGPIYGYNDLPPGDVVSDTQRALAQQGYYNGPIDGIIGPGTRSALRRFQIDHGLAVTAAIDQPTLYSLGLS